MVDWSLYFRYCNIKVFHSVYLCDPEKNKFQNLTSSSLSTDASVDKIFTRIDSVAFKQSC